MKLRKYVNFVVVLQKVLFNTEVSAGTRNVVTAQHRFRNVLFGFAREHNHA